jgi:hypothetical protein
MPRPALILTHGSSGTSLRPTGAPRKAHAITPHARIAHPVTNLNYCCGQVFTVQQRWGSRVGARRAKHWIEEKLIEHEARLRYSADSTNCGPGGARRTRRAFLISEIEKGDLSAFVTTIETCDQRQFREAPGQLVRSVRPQPLELLAATRSSRTPTSASGSVRLTVDLAWWV